MFTRQKVTEFCQGSQTCPSKQLSLKFQGSIKKWMNNDIFSKSIAHLRLMYAHKSMK